MFKKFQYSVGYYHQNIEANGELLAWHKCSDEVVRIRLDSTQAETAQACPSCGKPVSEWVPMIAARTDKALDGDKRHLYNTFHTVDSIDVSSNESNGADDSCVCIDVYDTWYSLRGSGSIITESSYFQEISIYPQTGYTYVFSGKTQSKEKKPPHEKKCLLNNCYCGVHTDLPSDALECVYEAVYAKMKAFHGEDVPSLKSYPVEMTLNNLIFYVRNPYINPVLYNRLINKGRHLNYKYGPLLKDVLVKNTCRNPVEQILAQSRIPNVKSLRRLAFEDVPGLSLLASISRTFKNPDLIRALYNEYRHCDYAGACYVDFSSKVFKTMVKHKGERIIATKLLSFAKHDTDNNADYALKDIIRCFDKLKPCRFDFSSSYDIEELHRYLTRTYANMIGDNKSIDYTKRQLSLKMAAGDLRISPVEDTYELAEVGAMMGNCVGSYVDLVLKKKSAIFVLRELGESRPVGCIELDGDSVVQAKASFNRRLQGKEYEFVKDWIAKKGLKVETLDLPGCGEHCA